MSAVFPMSGDRDSGPRLSSEERREEEKPILQRLLCRTPVGEGRTCNTFLAAIHVSGHAHFEYVCHKCRRASAFSFTPEKLIRTEPTIDAAKITREWDSPKR